MIRRRQGKGRGGGITDSSGVGGIPLSITAGRVGTAAARVRPPPPPPPIPDSPPPLLLSGGGNGNARSVRLCRVYTLKAGYKWSGWRTWALWALWARARGDYGAAELSLFFAFRPSPDVADWRAGPGSGRLGDASTWRAPAVAALRRGGALPGAGPNQSHHLPTVAPCVHTSTSKLEQMTWLPWPNFEEEHEPKQHARFCVTDCI